MDDVKCCFLSLQDDDNQFADADDGPSGPPASKKGKTYGEV